RAPRARRARITYEDPRPERCSLKSSNGKVPEQSDDETSRRSREPPLDRIDDRPRVSRRKGRGLGVMSMGRAVVSGAGVRSRATEAFAGVALWAHDTRRCGRWPVTASVVDRAR